MIDILHEKSYNAECLRCNRNYRNATQPLQQLL